MLGHKDYTRRNRKEWEKKEVSEVYEKEESPSRKILIEEISKTKAKSYLEYGCGCGVNCAMLKERSPKAKVTGADINKKFIEFANREYGRRGLSFMAIGENIEEHETVFTHATLMYIGKSEIKKTLESIVKLASKDVILVEWGGEKEREKYKRYIRDYSVLLAGMGIEAECQEFHHIRDKNWACQS